MTVPIPTAAEARSHQTFNALLWAFSYPGRRFSLPVDGLGAFGAIAEALVDLETSYYTDDAELQPTLLRTGGRARPVEAAMYQFYPALGDTGIRLLEAPAGSYAYPDEAATLVIGCTLGAGRALRLNGPGIHGVAHLWLDDIPDWFWPLREQVCRYPLGWEVVLVSGDQLVGLPRTTHIEVE
jgi:alpha-D-ribose 1-methylphosphonate 5-triphosphate synthase subunit PhnH